MVLLFLRDCEALSSSSPHSFALLTAVVALWERARRQHHDPWAWRCVEFWSTSHGGHGKHSQPSRGGRESGTVLEASRRCNSRLLRCFVSRGLVPSFFMTESHARSSSALARVGFAWPLRTCCRAARSGLSTWILREHTPEAEDTPSLLHRVGRHLADSEPPLAIRGLTVAAYVVVSVLVWRFSSVSRTGDFSASVLGNCFKIRAPVGRASRRRND